MATFLERWHDAALEVPDVWEPEAYAEAQRERIAKAHMTAFFASEVPRRLGGDAGPSELKAEKMVCRKIMARTTTSMKSWGGQPADLTEAVQHASEDDKREGIQVIWKQWWEETKAHLQAELAFVATVSIKTGHLKDGNRFANRHLNELNMLGQVLEGVNF